MSQWSVYRKYPIIISSSYINIIASVIFIKLAQYVRWEKIDCYISRVHFYSKLIFANLNLKRNIFHRADQMAAHQMYSQTGNSTESQIDQNMHNRNYYSTR